jgi:hypothetical protein
VCDDDVVDVEWAPPGEGSSRPEPHRSEPLPPPEVCAKCKTELLWVTKPIPGAGATQVPVCERCGDLPGEPPALDPKVCADCGADLVWQIMDPRAGFAPACERCGPMQVPTSVTERQQPGTETPWQHEVSFASIDAVGTGRSRGLTQTDVVSAVRIPHPSPGSRILF